MGLEEGRGGSGYLHGYRMSPLLLQALMYQDLYHLGYWPTSQPWNRQRLPDRELTMIEDLHAP